jgi:hypothetical protein
MGVWMCSKQYDAEQRRLDERCPTKRGAVIEIPAMIMHSMETGFNVDSQGTTIPVHIITDFVCRYAIQTGRAER